MTLKVPIRYLPFSLSKKDKKQQTTMLLKSRSLYKKNKYFTRNMITTYFEENRIGTRNLFCGNFN
jgi:hypothetical protein